MDTFTNEIESIKQHSITDEEIENFTIAPSVLHKIKNYKNTNKHNKRWRMIPTLTVLCLCIASVTTYAASEFVQIYNKNGDLVMDTYPLKDINETLYTYGVDQLKPEPKPGELVAYYAGNDVFKTKNGPKQILFKYNPVKYYDINEFYDKAKNVNSPNVTKPTYLPDGYIFSYAEIMARIPSPGDGVDSEYSRLLNELTLRASTSDDDKVFTEKINWLKSDGVHLYFSNQSEQNSLAVFASYGTKLSLSQPQEAISQKIQIGKKEALFIYNPNNADSNSKIAWYDDTTSTAYFMEDNSSLPLSKEQMVKIVDSIIN